MEAIIAGDYKFEPGVFLPLSPSPTFPLSLPLLPPSPSLPHSTQHSLTPVSLHRRILVQRLRNRQRLCAHVSHDRPGRAADGGGGAAAPVARASSPERPPFTASWSSVWPFSKEPTRLFYLPAATTRIWASSPRLSGLATLCWEMP